MQIQGIETIGTTELKLIQPAEKSNETTFNELVKNYLSQANNLQLKADDMIQKFATGEDVDLHQVMIAASEAQVSTELTLQLKNKFVETYQEVMRMQV